MAQHRIITVVLLPRIYTNNNCHLLTVADDYNRRIQLQLQGFLQEKSDYLDFPQNRSKRERAVCRPRRSAANHSAGLSEPVSYWLTTDYSSVVQYELKEPTPTIRYR